ncbi:MAG: response regulator [Candidatus Kuenenia sp.]|nr:response regulator [Candidatus Kuenenia hertensis]
MNKNDTKKKNASELREKAEEKLKPETIPLGNLSEAEVRKLAHELQIYKIELEMQAEELHKSQAQLEASMQKYYNLYDLAPAGYFTLNGKGFILEVNLAGTSMLGAERHSLINKPLSKFIMKEDADIYHLHRISVAESGNREPCELRMLKGDLPFYVLLESIAVKDADGNISQYFTIIVNISYRVMLENKLMHLAKFPEENPNPMLRISKEGKILYANRASSHLLNLWDRRINQILPQPWLKIVADALHNGTSMTFEGECCPRVYSLTFAPVAGEGYVNIYGIDITQRKRMEQELLQAKKLQAMGVMTTGIAHEFNNILAVIDGKIQMLMRENKGREKLLEEFRLIRNSVKDGAEIVRSMNKFTKVKEDRDWFVTIDIQEEIKNTIDLTRPEWKIHAEKEGITYSINQEDMKHVSRIKGNPLELREVLINLINNAIDAMPDGGTLSFSTREEGGNVIVNISDTGIGMDEDTQSNIFDPFFTTKDQGTGLGMSIVFGIVKRHGGKIEVQSQKGKGSTFTLIFPATKEPMDIPKKTREPDRTVSKKKSTKDRILIVDNEAPLGNALHKFLSEEGYNVTFIDNGVGALEHLKKEEFDLVLCDLGMPEVSGWDIMNAVNTMARKPMIGIITGFLSAANSFPAKEMKADFVINKPFELEEMLKQIQDLLEE